MIGQKEAQRVEVKTLFRVFASGLVNDWSCAIDGGAHVGTWAAAMAPRFRSVLAFEPTAETFGYLCQNVGTFTNVSCHNQAIMDRAGRVEVLQTRKKRITLTARFVKHSDVGPVDCISIDGLGLQQCGLIKLDLEGAEPLAILGARKTIRRCQPVLVIEVDGLSKRYGFGISWPREILGEMNYREAFREGVDRVYVPS